MMRPSVMIVGLGGLGAIILELLARERTGYRIVVASRNVARGQARCNLATLGALAQGRAPDIRFVKLDLTDRAATIETIRREQPDLILSTATRQTWWLPDLLPARQAAAINRAGFGVWLPVHLTLTRKLMEAVRDAEYGGGVMTAPFPDVVNCVLGRLGLAPTCGIGNLAEIVAKVRALAGARLRMPPSRIHVTLVAHHALEAWALGRARGEMPPYYLRVRAEDADAADAIGAGDLLRASFPLPDGPVRHFLTAGAAARLVRAFFSPRPVLCHAPGPGGLPGGYPVVAGDACVRLAPIEGLSRAEAIDINERSHRFDGIERIEADGTVVFRPKSSAVMREVLGYDCERLPPGDIDLRARELIARFRKYASRHGVKLDARRG